MIHKHHLAIFLEFVYFPHFSMKKWTFQKYFINENRKRLSKSEKCFYKRHLAIFQFLLIKHFQLLKIEAFYIILKYFMFVNAIYDVSIDFFIDYMIKQLFLTLTEEVVVVSRVKPLLSYSYHNKSGTESNNAQKMHFHEVESKFPALPSAHLQVQKQHKKSVYFCTIASIRKY